MSGASFLMLLPRGELANGEGMLFQRVAREQGLSPRRLDGGTWLAVAGPAAFGLRSAIIGEIFSHDGQRLPGIQEIADRLDHNRRTLHAEYWGNYVTIAESRDRTAVSASRSPFGDLPLYWMDHRSHVLAASSPVLLEVFAGHRLAIDWDALAIYLAAPELRGDRTCLDGVSELPGGSELSVTHACVAVRECWSPWRFVGGNEAINDVEEAAIIVGEAVDRAVAARCRHASGIVLLLSGGLDSSTVAAAIARANLPFTSLNMVARQRIGDEREYARAVSKALDTPLIEVMRSTDVLDWEDDSPRRLARPSARMFRQPTLAAAHRLAAELGADTIVDGGGGDNVFCSLQSVVPLLDRLAVEGFGRGAWKTAREIALRAKVGLPAVFSSAARRFIEGRTAFRWPTDTDFLSDAARSLEPEVTRHHWLQPARGALPGEAAHVALALGAISLAEDDSTRPGARTISPLVSQPVVEAALRVRSWLWFDRGRNRAVIRRALEGRLPASVIFRTGKGTPAGFMGEIVEDHRGPLQDLLLGGLLVANGVADRVEIEAELTLTAQAPGHRFSRLLVIADAERWARVWSTTPGNPGCYKHAGA